MGKSIIISSAKGGVGKTSVAVNLGVSLAELGKTVALIDGSLTTPDVSLYLGIPFHVRGLSHVLKEDYPLSAATYIHKSGMRVIPGNIHLEDYAVFEGEEFPKLIRKLRRACDFVLVDGAAGLGQEATSAIRHCNEALIVTNPELPSVVNSSKAIQTALDLRTKPTGVVLNRTGRFRQELRQDKIEPLLYQVPVVGNIPEDIRVSIAARHSEAVVNHSPRCPASRQFRNLALSLSGAKPEPTLVERLLGRFRQ